MKISTDELLSTLSPIKLAEAYAELNVFYRERTPGSLPPLKNWEQKCAYLAARFPATLAAVQEVLNRTRAFYPYPVKSLLDLGAGPGTAFFAAKEIFPELSQVHLVERDADFIKMGKILSPYKEALWEQRDFTELQISKPYDLIIISYSLGELPFAEQAKLLHKLWPFAELLTIIEPGTPRGFATIRAMRAELIQLGGFPVAPCPHANACPMPENDWCHFSVRLTRSKSHRFVKQAELSYEDEKFSYISFSKKQVPLPSSRILRHPMKHAGHINFTLCTPDGLQKRIVSKKEGEFYKKARKLEWGDPLDCSTLSREK